MPDIKNRADYLDGFPQAETEKNVRAEALKCALDTRKFEIDLYWKRTAYFWTLIGAAFAGYIALETAHAEPASSAVAAHPHAKFLVSCIGLVFSVGWYLLNRGSKYWQKNWERQVDLLEDAIIGPLFKTRVSSESFPFRDLLRAYPFSVSKINQALSLFVVLLWLGLAVASFPFVSWPTCSAEVAVALLAILTVFFVAVLLLWARTDPQDKPIEVKMETRRFEGEHR